MSGRARSLLQAVVTLLAVAGIGAGLWWASTDPPPPGSAVGEREAVPATPTSETDSTADATPESTAVTGDGTPSTASSVPTGPTAGATATSVPATPTPVPEPRPFVEILGRPELADDLGSPLPQCTLHGGDLSAAGTIALRCVENWALTDVEAVGPGRIVHVNRSPVADVSELLQAGVPVGVFSWTAHAGLGPHVVVDHGPWLGRRNVQTVYAGLDGIDGSVQVGALVEAGQRLGGVRGPDATLQFSIWQDNVRQDGAQAVTDGPGVEVQRRAAAAIGPTIVSPTDPLCPLSLGSTQLPNAPRGYRNGTHQGIDFGCGTSDRFGHAIAEGTVVYLVDDYEDPAVAEREALLRNAGLAGFTPHWTLVMLYGNVVVIDHGLVEGAGRLYTIAAHLESVDPAITLGSQVTAGQVLGELGNRGTNAAAEGLRGSQDPSLHLHWELFFDTWYLGSGQPPVVVEELVLTTLCDNAATAGCPA